MSLSQRRHYYQQRVEQQLHHYLPATERQPLVLQQAMRYAVLEQGKRVRPLLVYLTGEALAIPEQRLDAAACAVEFIHAYSLVHDDLPAMDDDDLRRGKPSCHKAFDEATAILVGDTLQTLAFEVLSYRSATLDAQRALQMVQILAKASGFYGMGGGQALDIVATGQKITLVELENIHIHKTGALIHAAVKLAMLCTTDIDEQQQQALEHYAKCIGLAFQVQDDILDEEGDTKMLGKPSGSDRKQGKLTYPAIVGLSAARQMAQELVDDALQTLDIFNQSADPLRWLASYIITRQQ